MITVVVAAAFDSDSDAHLEQLRSTLPVTGVRGRRPTLRPHLTLSAARVSRVERVSAVARRVAKRHGPFALTLSQWGRFQNVVWIGPRRSQKLGALHRDVWQSMIDAGWPPAFAGQSDPADWIPHCTLLRGELADDPPQEPVRVRVTDLLVLIVGRGVAAQVPLVG